jgi:hypothetical protein
MSDLAARRVHISVSYRASVPRFFVGKTSISLMSAITRTRRCESKVEAATGCDPWIFRFSQFGISA